MFHVLHIMEIICEGRLEKNRTENCSCPYFHSHGSSVTCIQQFKEIILATSKSLTRKKANLQSSGQCCNAVLCKLVTVHVLPLWLSFSAQCNLSLSEWGILLLSFMIIVLIYLHNILMLQDVASPVVVFVMLCHISMWRLLSYYGPRVPGAVALLNRTNITTDIETSASWPNLIVHYFVPLQIFFFSFCEFFFCIP